MYQIIFADQQYLEKVQLISCDSDVKMSETQYCSEGFLQGTLVKTVHGYVPIEQIEVGDILVGMQKPQEVLSIQISKVDGYVRLLMMHGECVYAAIHQKFYLDDQALHPATDLSSGYRLLDGQYIVDSEIIDEPSSCYSLTTEDNSFFIYPDIYVHNYNLVALGATGVSWAIGAVEVLNPVTICLGVIATLSWYAIQYFRSNTVYNYEFSDEDIKLTIEKLCLQHADVIKETRNYYDIKRRALNNLYQDLIKIKNDVAIFVRPNTINNFDFSFGLLSQYTPAIYNLLALPGLAFEIGASLANKEKLMFTRQAELDKLQQDIFDTHLTLAFHVTELIDRRDKAIQHLEELCEEVHQKSEVWNFDLKNISVNTALTLYEIEFYWKEMLDNLEMKTNELEYVITYYEKLKHHFFMTKTTNLINVFIQQRKMNRVQFEYLKERRAVWFSNMTTIEDLLKRRNLLSHQLVSKYQTAAQQYRLSKDKNIFVFTQKKKDEIQKHINKDLEDKKKGGGGGPEDPEDPESPDEVLGFFKNSLTHGFKNEDGHIPLNTPENRKWILDMAKKAENYLGRDKLRGNDWYAEILKDGRQLWTSVRDRYIRNFGLNEIPALFDPQSGLCTNILKK